MLFTRMTAAKAADLEKTKTTATIIYRYFFVLIFIQFLLCFAFFVTSLFDLFLLWIYVWLFVVVVLVICFILCIPTSIFCCILA